MLYLVHDEDGRIYQSNKVYGQPDYSKVLHEHGMSRHIALNMPNVLDNNYHFIWHGELCNRPSMPIVQSRDTIKPDDKDTALITGIPLGAKVTVAVGGMILAQEKTNTGLCEITAQAPAVYEITVEKFPYVTWIGRVTAQ